MADETTGAGEQAAVVEGPSQAELEAQAKAEAEAKVAAEKEAVRANLDAILAGLDRVEIEKERGVFRVKVIGHSTTQHGHGKTVAEALYDAGYRAE